MYCRSYTSLPLDGDDVSCKKDKRLELFEINVSFLLHTFFPNYLIFVYFVPPIVGETSGMVADTALNSSVPILPTWMYFWRGLA